MGFRFQKRLRIAPGLHLNLSKSGVGVSAKLAGLTLSAGSRGVRGTASLPGSGLSISKRLDNGGSSKEKADGHEPGAITSLDDLGTHLAPQPTGLVKALVWSVLLIPFLLGPLIILVWLLMPGPKSARRFNAALDALRRNEPLKALALLEDALRLNTSNHTARRLLVVILGELDRFDEALLAAQTLIAAEPNHGPHWVQAVALLCETNRAAEVPALLERAPLDGNMLALCSDVLLEAEQYAEVIQVVQKSAHLESESAGERLRLNLGRAFYGLQQWAIAAEVLKKGPIGSRNRSDAVLNEYRYWLGLCFLQSGDKEKAKSQLSKVYADDVQFRDVANYMTKLD